MEVIIIKTVIGEELVAGLVADCHPTINNAITVSKPRILQLHPNEKGGMSTALVPWMILDPDNAEVPMAEHYIASRLPASNDLSKSYLSTVSGIALLK